MKLEGRGALVTGASSGIGRALALELAKRGARVGLAARRVDRLEELAAEIGEAVVLPADLSVRGEAEALAERAMAELGEVDVLVNNAGASVQGLAFAVADGDEARDVFELNVWSALALMKRLVPPMRERRSGAVVNITTMMMASPFPRLGLTVSSKAALSLATEVSRIELASAGVNVIEVPLGMVDTDGLAHNRSLPGAKQWMRPSFIGKPERAAKAIANGIERGRSRVFYKRSLAPAYAMPLPVRRLSRRYARFVEPTATS